MHCHRLNADRLDIVTIAHRYASPANWIKNIKENLTRGMGQAWCIDDPPFFFTPSYFTLPGDSPNIYRIMLSFAFNSGKHFRSLDVATA